VWAQNSAARILDGTRFNVAYTRDVDVLQGPKIPVEDENGAFALANTFGRALADLRGRAPALASLGFEFSADRRIEVSWPDRFVGPSLSFTEPTSATGFPLVHLKDESEPTVWHEYGHAVHFALLPHDVRDAIKADYLGWLLSNLSDPTHSFAKQTSELVAWIEAWGDFCGGST
jgi:hypothetical protein